MESLTTTVLGQSSGGGGGGGATQLDDLTDVIIAGPENGEVLKYDSVAGAWVNETISGGGATTLDGLTDVTITGTPANGQVLKYDSVAGVWKNDTIAGGGTPGGSNTQLQYNNSGAFGGSSDLTFASASGTLGVKYGNFTAQGSAPSTPAGGYVLYANSSNALSWKGANGYVRVFDGTANTADRTYTLPNASGTVALVGGSDTQVLFNDGGAVGGDADLTYNKTSNKLTTKGDVELNDGGSFTTTLQVVTPTANRTISLPDATGTAALVAGSSGQLIYNSSGAYAGASTTSVDGSGNITLSGRMINSTNGAASAPASTLTGTWFTGGTATTTKPQFLVEVSGATSTNWSTSGTGIGVNAASGFAGNLLDLQVNGTSRVQSTSSFGILVAGTTGGISTWNQGITLEYTRINDQGIGLYNGVAINFSGGSSGSVDLKLLRDAANTLAQRNGTSAQTFRVYNTYTSGTNYELGKLEWSSNVFRIGTEKGSGGGTARTVEVHTDSVSRLALDTTGSVRVVTGLTVATLPGTPSVGMIARVTDASAPAVGSTVAGGGAAAALVWYNGANWTVLGV